MEIPDVRNLGENDTVAFKTLSAAASSLALGMISGAVAATWNDVPAVERNQALPAFRKTARVMGSYGTYFAAVGGVFAATDAIAQEIRGKRDIWNGVMGGFAAGGIVGLKAGSISTGAGACVAFAVASALVDASGQVTRTPIGREYLPFKHEGPAPSDV